MATIRLHLIGNDKEYIFKLKKTSFTFLDIISHLVDKGLTFDEVRDIKFIYKGETIDTNKFKIYESIGYIFPINIYTYNKELLCELTQKIFKSDSDSESDAGMDSESEKGLAQASDSDSEVGVNYDYKLKQTSSIVQLSTDTMKYIGKSAHEYIVPLKREPLPDTEEDDSDEEELSEEELDKINQVIVSDLKDPDFLKLLHICITKPDYLDKAASYITNGTMVDKIDDIHTMKGNSKFINQQEKLITILSSLDIKLDDNIVLSIITHFKGHINLSLRYILSLVKFI